MAKIIVDGVIRDMTEDEEKAYEADVQRIEAELAKRPPTPQEQIAAQAQEIADLKEALTMLLEGVTEDG